MLSNSHAGSSISEFLLGVQHYRIDTSRLSEDEYRPSLPPLDDPIETAPAEIPRVLFADRYQLEDKLPGRGLVFRALELKYEYPVAVRIVPKSRFTDSEAIVVFLAQGDRCMDLEGRGFSQIFDVGELPNCCFVVTELIDGATLAELVSKSSKVGHHFEIIQAVDHARTLCIAAALAAKARVHFDPDPNNIVFSVDGRLRLTDQAVLQPLDRERHHFRRRTMHALGVCMHAMLFGEQPSARSAILSPLREGVPDRLDRLVTALLAANTARRIPDLNRVIVELNTVAAQLRTKSKPVQLELNQAEHALIAVSGEPERPAPPPTANVRVRRGNRRFLYGTVSFLILVTALLGYGVWFLQPAVFASHAQIGVARASTTAKPREFRVAPVSRPSLASSVTRTDGRPTLEENEINQDSMSWHKLLTDELLINNGSNISDPATERTRLLFGYSREELEPEWKPAGAFVEFASVPAARVDLTPAPVPVPPELVSPIPTVDVPVVEEPQPLPDPQSWISQISESVANFIHELQKAIAAAPPKPDVQIGKASFREIYDGGKKGVQIRFPLRVNHFAGDKVEVGAYFSTPNDRRLKDLDGQYRSQRGYVYAKKIIALKSDRMNDAEFSLFLPFVEFDELSGGTHKLAAQVFVWSGPRYDQRMAAGAKQNFTVTLYKFAPDHPADAPSRAANK